MNPTCTYTFFDTKGTNNFQGAKLSTVRLRECVDSEHSDLFGISYFFSTVVSIIKHVTLLHLLITLQSKEKKKLKRKTSNIKKQQSRHGVILQGSDHKLLKSVTAIESEEEDEPDDEEQENIKKMKEKV